MTVKTIKCAHSLTPSPSPAKAGEGSFQTEMACGHYSEIN